MKKLDILGKLQKTPKWRQVEFEEVEYKALSIKDILTEMKNISELIIDLAYSALIFQDEDIAEEVKYLEARMDYLNYEIRMIAMMAARTKEDAEKLSGILQIAEAAESLSNAAGDIVKILQLGKSKIKFLTKILKEAEEKIFKTKIPKNSPAKNKTIGELRIESETGIKIIAIRRKDYWIYNPGADTTLKEGDTLIMRGNESGYKELKDFIKGKRRELD